MIKENEIAQQSPGREASAHERLVMMPHFLALMEGLEIPNPEWYLQQHPDILRRVGAAIAHQAKQAS